MRYHHRTPWFKFGSHLPVLIKVLSITHGPCLEMGMGYNSSTVFHWMCATEERELVSYENSPEYFGGDFKAERFANEWHKVIRINDWNEAEIERPWDVALLDQGPAERRKEDVKRLANYAKYIIIHDSEGRNERHFHYHEIYPLFKWQYNYDKFIPHTSILSNFIDLTDFKV